MNIVNSFNLIDQRNIPANNTKASQSSFKDILNECNSLSESDFNDDLSELGPNVPKSVNDSWEKSVEETGTSGLCTDSEGRLTHISQLIIMRSNNLLLTGHSNNNILGNSQESAIEFAQQALNNLNNPLLQSNNNYNSEYKEKEKEFYMAFLKYLNE